MEDAVHMPRPIAALTKNQMGIGSRYTATANPNLHCMLEVRRTRQEDRRRLIR